MSGTENGEPPTFGLEANTHGYHGVPRFKGQPWRGACPECGSRSIKRQYRSTTDDNVWLCFGCDAYNFDPVDVKGGGD